MAGVDKVIVIYRADNSGCLIAVIPRINETKLVISKIGLSKKKQHNLLCVAELPGNLGITSGNSGHLVYSVLVPYSAGSIMTLIFKKTGIDILAASVMGICCTARDDKVVSIITSIN